MNLFGYEKEKINILTEYGPMVQSLSKFNSHIQIELTSDGDEFVNLKITNLLSDETKDVIAHTVDEFQLDNLIKDLSKVKEKLINNKKSEEYPLEPVERLYYSIIENHCKVKFGTTRIPRPKINVYIDDDEIRLTAVDFHNNKIIMNHIISEEYLRTCIDGYTIDDIFESIVNAISSELNLAAKNRRGIFKGVEQFKYLGEYYVEEIKTIGAENIIREYLFNFTTIEDDVIKLFMEEEK